MTILPLEEEVKVKEVKPGSYTDIVLSPRMIKLSKTPINKTKLALFMINHHIVRLHITMHDSLRMTIF